MSLYRDMYTAVFALSDADGSDRIVHRVTWPVLAWQLERGERVSQSILAAAEQFALKTGRDPEMAMIKVLPKGAENLAMVGRVTLVETDWVASGFVYLGRPDMKTEEINQWQTPQKQLV